MLFHFTHYGWVIKHSLWGKLSYASSCVKLTSYSEDQFGLWNLAILFSCMIPVGNKYYWSQSMLLIQVKCNGMECSQMYSPLKLHKIFTLILWFNPYLNLDLKRVSDLTFLGQNDQKLFQCLNRGNITTCMASYKVRVWVCDWFHWVFAPTGSI